MNILFCSAGRRAGLINCFRETMGAEGRIVAADMDIYAPALYAADRHYVVPGIMDPGYTEAILGICREEKIDAMAVLIDPEIEIAARNREKYGSEGVMVLAPKEQTAHMCYDKFLLYEHMERHGLSTVPTWDSIGSFQSALSRGEASYPVFVKPRTGSGSVGAKKIGTEEELKETLDADPFQVIQEYMGDALDLDVDVYVDMVSGKVVSVFSKRKLETKIGGASKAVSFHDPRLVDQVIQVASALKLRGPCDMDFFYRDGKYYISEINPRFGGAYLHAYGAGVDFVRLIMNNLEGNENEAQFGNYEEDIAMLMYDSVVVRKI